MPLFVIWCETPKRGGKCTLYASTHPAMYWDVVDNWAETVGVWPALLGTFECYDETEALAQGFAMHQSIVGKRAGNDPQR